jgi:hypothetical protein
VCKMGVMGSVDRIGRNDARSEPGNSVAQVKWSRFAVSDSLNWGKLVDRLGAEPGISRREFWEVVERPLMQCLARSGAEANRTAAAHEVRNAFRAFAAINHRDGGRLAYVVQAYESLQLLLRGTGETANILRVPLSVISEDEMPEVEQWIERLRHKEGNSPVPDLAARPAVSDDSRSSEQTTPPRRK